MTGTLSRRCEGLLQPPLRLHFWFLGRYFASGHFRQVHEGPLLGRSLCLWHAQQLRSLLLLCLRLQSSQLLPCGFVLMTRQCTYESSRSGGERLSLRCSIRLSGAKCGPLPRECRPTRAQPACR